MTIRERKILRKELEMKMHRSEQELNILRAKVLKAGSIEKEQNNWMIQYELGMLRGLGRALSLIEDLEEIKEDYRIRKEVV